MKGVEEVVVIGGGHNGLVAACYLARAGLSVTVLEAAPTLGGGSRTEETIPGYHFNTHSAAHNIINMTSIPYDLDLFGAGLRYVEMDPFAIGVAPGQPVLRFFRSIEATLSHLAVDDPSEAARYEAWIDWAVPLVDAAVGFLEGGGPRSGLGAAFAALRALRRLGGPASMAAATLAPYGSLLSRLFATERVRAPVAAFAAHASVGPDAAGGAYFAVWQAAYHRFGQWHALGGAQALADALALRLDSYGGRVVTGCPVDAIETRAGKVSGIRSAGGERYPADAVLAAIHPQVALDLVEPSPDGAVVEGLRAAHTGSAVQLVVHVATTALPAYQGAQPGDWNGLQSHVGSIHELSAGFAEAQSRRLPVRPPTYAFTPSALDAGLAPPGHHTVYLACPCAPAAVDGGWSVHAEPFAEAMFDQLEAHAPGFRDSIVDWHVRTPELMARELRLPGAHPMHLDITLDQLGPLRPTRALGNHRTPVAGLLLAGAGSSPTGGISELPGRNAARRLLADLKHKHR